MTRKLIPLIVACGTLALAACRTVGGAAIGAGIGSISGHTETGAIIGGSAGLLSDIL
jgi:predicted small secreted protein